MPFVHPGTFWAGLGAASVPVIIHLLNRRRFKVLDWAAMRFIVESVRKNRRRIRLEELLLLLLRCLAVVLLAVAVGRFLGCAPGQILPAVGTAGRTTHVFCLDDSVSMGQKIADATAFAKATSDLAGLLAEIPTGDQVAVLLTSRPRRSEAVIDLGRLTERSSLTDRLRSLERSDTAGGLHAALHTAAEMLADVDAEKRLYVLSDFRRADYVSAGELDSIRRELAELRADGVRLILMNYGAGPGTNLTAEGIEALDKLVIAGVPVRVQLRVRNNGPKRAENVSVRILATTAEGMEVNLPARTITSIDPGDTELVQLGYTFPDAGSAVLRAELAADGLAGDNQAHLALSVRQARKVLLIDGDPDVADPTRAESFYLSYALDPRGDGRYGNAADVVPADHLTGTSFRDYDAAVLANVSDLPAEQVEALDAYVRAGGGLVIFTGERVNRQFYNDALYRGGAGLCPVRIGPPAGDARKREKFVRLLRESIANEAVMRAFQGRRSPFTQLLRFYAYTPVEQIAPSAAQARLGPVRVLARFDNTDVGPRHSPAIVVRGYGKGTVAVVLTSADKDWTDWPKDITYVAFVNDLLEYVSRPGAQGFTARVGQPISYSVDPGRATARISLQTPAFPAEDVVGLEGQQVGPDRVVTYENTRHAGTYQLRLDLPDRTETVMFARNVDPREGRLDVASEADLLGYLGTEFEYQDRLSPTPAEAPTGSPRREYWKAALGLLLVVLALEVFLGQRFGHYQ